MVLLDVFLGYTALANCGCSRWVPHLSGPHRGPLPRSWWRPHTIFWTSMANWCMHLLWSLFQHPSVMNTLAYLSDPASMPVFSLFFLIMMHFPNASWEVNVFLTLALLSASAPCITNHNNRMQQFKHKSKVIGDLTEILCKAEKIWK